MAGKKRAREWKGGESENGQRENLGREEDGVAAREKKLVKVKVKVCHFQCVPIAKGMQKPETFREVFRSSKVFLVDVLLLRQSIVAEAERIWKSFWTQSLDVKPQKSWELLPSRLICREEASIRTRCQFDPDMRIKGHHAYSQLLISVSLSFNLKIG